MRLLANPVILALLALGAAVPSAARAQQPPAQAPAAQTSARVSGRVLRADTGRPLAKAVVVAALAARPQESVTVRTDADGRFSIVDLAPGAYRLRAQRSGFVAQLYGQRGGGPGITLNLVPGQHLERLEFRLEPAGVISGRIYDEDGEPVEGVPVAALRVRFEPGGRLQVSPVRTTRTDDRGDYRLSGLAPGSYYVQAARQSGVSIGGPVAAFGYTPVFYKSAYSHQEALRVQVSSAGETYGIDIAVRTTLTYNISGIVLDAGAARPGRQVAVGFARGGGMALTELDRAGGTFTLRGISPGDYTLVGTVAEPDGRSRRGYLSVRVVDSDLRVSIPVGRTAELRGRALVDDDQPFSFSGLRVSLEPEGEDAVTGGGPVEETGQFRVADLPPGRYWLRLQGREEELYLRRARCAGEDFTDAPMELGSAQSLGGCELTISRAVGAASGVVREDSRPVAGQVVVVIPQQRERRRNPRHTGVGQTDEEGRFHIPGVIPGEYFVFAVPPAEDAAYYDLDFAERNRDHAERLTVKARELSTLNLKPVRPN